ncbi:MAG: hypothetical protein EBX36_13655, partial [Planctomycetia bacterium]|nr:hypothetical protein [Planctomycetia bacterium]
AAHGGRRPQLVVARPSRDDDEIWAVDQALRCPGVAVVLAWPGRVHPTAMRRWQLAARSSGAVGLLVRGLSGRLSACEPTWADTRVAVAPVVERDAVVDPAVRRLRLVLAGGAWSGSDMLVDRSVEVLLDTVHGREAVCRRPLPSHQGPRPATGAASGPMVGPMVGPMADSWTKGAACRAS